MAVQTRNIRPTPGYRMPSGETAKPGACELLRGPTSSNHPPFASAGNGVPGKRYRPGCEPHSRGGETVSVHSVVVCQPEVPVSPPAAAPDLALLCHRRNRVLLGLTMEGVMPK